MRRPRRRRHDPNPRAVLNWPGCPMTCPSSSWAPGRRGSRARAPSRGSASVRLCSSATPRSAPAGPSATTAFGFTRSRRFSGLAHHPLPRELPRYVAKDEFARYLRDYAVRLGLDVRPDTDVSRIRRDGDGWLVEAPAARSALLSSSSPPGSTTRRSSRVARPGDISRLARPLERIPLGRGLRGPGRAGRRLREHRCGDRGRPRGIGRESGGRLRPNLASDTTPGRRRHPHPAAWNGSLGAAASSRRPDRVGATAGRDRRPQPLRPRAGRVGAVHRQAAAGHRRWLPAPAPRTARRDPARRRAPDRTRGRLRRRSQRAVRRGRRGHGIQERPRRPRRTRWGARASARRRSSLGPGLPQGLYVIGLRETVRGDLFETRRDSLALAHARSRATSLLSAETALTRVRRSRTACRRFRFSPGKRTLARAGCGWPRRWTPSSALAFEALDRTASAHFIGGIGSSAAGRARDAAQADRPCRCAGELRLARACLRAGVDAIRPGIEARAVEAPARRSP